MQTKNAVIQWAGQLGLNDVTLGLVNSTCVSPNQKSKPSWGLSLSLYKNCI